MDNGTLMITLVIILGVNLLFTILITRNTGRQARREWRFSSLALFIGFLMIMLQGQLIPLFSILTANYLIILGFFFQVTAAFNIEQSKGEHRRMSLTGISIAYWISFSYFTYVRFDTSLRIITVSLFLCVFFLYGLLRLRESEKGSHLQRYDTKELQYLFLYSLLFYLFRTIFTLAGTGRVGSLFDRNIVTTLSLLNLILYNLVFLMGMFNTSLRLKNHQLLREKEKMRALFEFLNDTVRHLNLDDLYRSIEEILKKTLGVSTAVIYLIDEDEKSHSIVYVYDKLDIPLDTVRTLKRGEGVSGQAIEQDRVIVSDISNYSLESIRQELKDRGASHVISAPLRSPGGIIGAVSAVYSEETRSRLLDREFFSYLGEQIGLVLNNAILYERIRHQAHTDPLTGLNNRRRMLELFRQEIKRAERSGRGFSIALADLDHFKSINDRFGHDCGDEVLKKTSDLFRQECRGSDYISRWGGEEFLLLFIESELSESLKISERIRLRLEETIHPCAENESITISMGITVFNPDLSLEQMITLTDDALYEAKKRGRNRIEVR